MFGGLLAVMDESKGWRGPDSGTVIRLALA